MAVLPVLFAWVLVSIVATLGLGRWLSRADTMRFVTEDDVRIIR